MDNRLCFKKIAIKGNKKTAYESLLLAFLLSKLIRFMLIILKFLKVQMIHFLNKKKKKIILL